MKTDNDKLQMIRKYNSTIQLSINGLKLADKTFLEDAKIEKSSPEILKKLVSDVEVLSEELPNLRHARDSLISQLYH
jgi:hypothetical protein